MALGFRTPSLKKSFKARTTGAFRRAAKRAVVPGYGSKGTGWATNPKKAVYNKVYNKTTTGVSSIISYPKGSSVSPTNNLNGELYQRHIDIVNDCARLIQSTRNPDTFFHRLNLYIEELQLLSAAEQNGVVRFQGESIKQKYEQIGRDKAICIDEFIDRYAYDTQCKIGEMKTERAKVSQSQHFRDTLQLYSGQMPSLCLDHTKTLGEQLSAYAAGLGGKPFSSDPSSISHEATSLPVHLKSAKSKTTTLLLAIFLGFIGAHRFYSGKIGTSILWFCTIGVFYIGWIYDIVKIAKGEFTDKEGLPITK